MSTKTKLAFLRRLIQMRFFRLVTVTIIRSIGSMGRLASFARVRALFPHAPDLVLHWSTEVKYVENISFGRGVVIGSKCTIGAKAPIYIGDNVLISKSAYIETGTADISSDPPYTRMAKPIRIERNVWIGAGAMILAGVTIGEGSMVAAGTIVRKSVPPNSIVASARATVQRFSDE